MSGHRILKKLGREKGGDESENGWRVVGLNEEWRIGGRR
jgi:hypothetical protein